MILPVELCCPEHGGGFTASDSVLVCASGCRIPVVGGIPRFVDSSLYAAAFGRQWKDHPRTQLDSETGVPVSRERLVRCLGGSLDVVRGQTVLEVGCGAGRFTEILLEAGARVIACDLSDAVDVNALNCGNRAGYFAIQADVRRLPVAPAAFDFVLALGMVQHTPDPEETLEALAAHVRPGGRLILDHYTVLPRDTWYFRALTAVHPRHLTRRTVLALPARWQTAAAGLVTSALLPLHRSLWRAGAGVGRMRRLWRRISPVSDYYDRYPALGVARLAEWSRLDTHDALTDRYKHLRNPEQIAAALRFAGLGDIEVGYGGNGVEARGRAVAAPPARQPRRNRRREALRVVVVARLDDAKLASKVEPLLDLPEVAEVVVVRRTPLRVPGVRNACPPAALARASVTAEPWRLAAVLQEAARAPDRTVLVSFFLMPHAIHADWARRLLRVPTVPVLLGDEDVARAESSPFFRNALDAAHAVGVRGPRSAERLVAAGVPRHKLFSPPNVFDMSPFTPDTSVVPDVDVCFVGKFYSSKRLDVLLEAAALVHARRGRVRVALVGDGPDRRALEADIHRRGLTADVTLTGALPPDEVAAWLRRSRLFLMTSEQEGLPMALVEALSCGVPAVIGDVGDVTSVARHGESAWIVGDRRAASFAAAVCGLLDDEALRSRLAAGARAVAARFTAEYSCEAARAAWQPVLANLLDRRNGKT